MTMTTTARMNYHTHGSPDEVLHILYARLETAPMGTRFVIARVHPLTPLSHAAHHEGKEKMEPTRMILF
jgi:hypothetical protein